MLNKQQVPDKAKDVEACLKDEIINKKKKAQKPYGTLRMARACLWKVKKKEQKQKKNKTAIKVKKQVVNIIACNIVKSEQTTMVMTMSACAQVECVVGMGNEAINAHQK